MSPASTEQRQINIALSLIVEQLPSFNVFWYDAAGVRTHDHPVVRRTLYWLSQHTGAMWEFELQYLKKHLTILIQVL